MVDEPVADGYRGGNQKGDAVSWWNRKSEDAGAEAPASYFLKHYNEPGTAPGVLDQGRPAGECRLRLVRYTAESYEVREAVRVEDCPSLIQGGLKTWLVVEGTPAAGLLQRIGECFQLHPLALEDVLHAGQRAKLDDFDSHLFLVLPRPRWAGRQLSLSQVSLFLGKDFVVSIDETGDDLFEPVRRRLETSPRGRIRSSGSDYLYYALVDMVVDQAFPILEGYAVELEELELAVLNDPKQEPLLDRIHETRRELAFLRRSLWSQRDATGSLLREDMKLIDKTTRLYLRDCHDHAIHSLDLADTYRDMSGALADLLLNMQNRQLNDVMRVLTIIATIFIPLSFVVGLYGMNFNTEKSPWNMPELNWAYGYPVLLLVLLGIGGGMLVYFKRKGWL